MIIRLANENDITDILQILDHAKKFMIQNGNTHQWNGPYPAFNDIEHDIKNYYGYVLEHEDKIVGYFAFIQDKDPTYSYIEGNWLNDKPYGVIHRIASNGTIKGITDIVVKFCFNKCSNLKIDTHKDNKVMQNALLRNGFIKCGIIYLKNGDPRIAYQKDK